jgi:hypothetical protein
MSVDMRNRHRGTAIKSQNGFALLMVMLLTTVVLLGAMAAAPYIRTERQREKEEEMIWRGKQYVRGIKLYYRKMGRFPTSMDDLTKPKLGSLRFMRQAYKDPMNTADGSWRLIYVSPSGQLIGSLKPPQTFQMPGTPAGANPQKTTSFGASGFGQSPPAQGGSPQGQPGVSQSGASPGQTASGAQGSNATPVDDAANATPSGMLNSDTPLMGGNIIGLGSKINKRSIIIYDKAKNYRLFEFVWNPSKDMANALNQQMGAPNPSPSPRPASPFGPQNTSPMNGPGMPMPTPTPNQNPPQQ